jgi:hypothetical protein
MRSKAKVRKIFNFYKFNALMLEEGMENAPMLMF